MVFRKNADTRPLLCAVILLFSVFTNSGCTRVDSVPAKSVKSGTHNEGLKGALYLEPKLYLEPTKSSTRGQEKSVSGETHLSTAGQTNSYYLVTFNMVSPITDYVWTKNVDGKTIREEGHFDPPIGRTCTYSDPKQCATEHKWRQIAFVPCDGDVEMALWSLSEPKWLSQVTIHNQCSYAYYWDWLDQKP